MSLPTQIQSVNSPDIHILANAGMIAPGHVFDAVVALDPLFRSSLRLTQACVKQLVPERWPEAAGSSAEVVLVLDSHLAQTVDGVLANPAWVDPGEDGYAADIVYRRRVELAENAAEEAAVARAFRGTGPIPAVVIWSDDPRVERLGLSTL